VASHSGVRKNLAKTLAKSVCVPKFSGSFAEMMNWNTFCALLAMGPQPTDPSKMANPKAETLKLVGMMVMMGFVMYFIMIRPQRQRQKQLETLLKSIKAGDKVLTASGIVGVVLSVKDKTVTLRSADTKLEVLKSAVSEVTEKGGESTSADSSKN
jgi:preprotein translocase subunit YajC